MCYINGMDIQQLTRPEVAKKLITDLGGPTALAALLGYDARKGGQRVHKWLADGLPADVALHFGKMLLKNQYRILRKQALAKQNIALAAIKS
jgi:hypothetical protein